MELLTRVRCTVEKHRLLQGGEVVVVGVSGGVDSVCLLHVLVALREDHDLRLQVAHLNHSARGREADRDAAFVADLSRAWGIPALGERIDVPQFARSRGIAFEEAARRVRYGFLARVAATVGSSTIAVGHNADDQAETVLMHLIRGAGLAGLRGMRPATPLTSLCFIDRGSSAACDNESAAADLAHARPVRGRFPGDIAVIRPLLDVSRDEILSYCVANCLDYRFDLSNLDTTYFRNRLRHELIPLLETYNPRIRERLHHMAAVAAADYQLLADFRDRAWRQVAQVDAANERLVIDRRAWQALPTALQRATLRQAVRQLRPGLRDVSYRHVEDARRLAAFGPTGAQATLPSHLVLRVGYDALTMSDARAPQSFPDEPLLEVPEPLALSVPGTTLIPGSSWRVVADVLQEWDLERVQTNDDVWTAYLDMEQLRKPVVLRTRERGDTFRPQGMGGRSVRLSPFLINRKVPRHIRDRVPLLVASGKILWVCGRRIAEGASVGSATSKVVRVRFERVVAEEESADGHAVPLRRTRGDRYA